MDLYTLEGDGVSLRRETFPQEICTVSRTNHGGHTGYKNKISLLHRAHRRGQFMLWTGDLARAAFALSRPAADIAPPPLMVGQLRIFADGVCAETVPTETVFSPEGAKWVCRFADKTLEIVSAIVSESEACVRVRVRGNDGGAKDAELTCTFGGPLLCSRPYDAGWLGLEPKPYPCALKEEKCAFALAETDGKEFCRFRFYTAEKAQYAAEDDTLTCKARGNELTFTVGIGDAPAFVEGGADVLFKRGKEYFSSLLNACRTQTPQPLLSAAFRCAVVEQDNTHRGDGWLEGGHWFSCYWTNNFQISAALALGQDEAVRRALVFFGTRKDGYNCIDALGNNAWLYPTREGEKNYGYEGLPYYLYELDEYVQATGDISVVKEVFPGVDRALRYMLRVRTDKNSGLLGWRHGCNAFLYQADSLSLPGAASSPSIMIGSVLKKFAALAGRIGEKDAAAFYEEKGSFLLRKARELLWDEEDGAYVSHTDGDGAKHSAHYYTDYVFPALYGQESETDAARSLYRLKERLTFRSDETGELLMRVGELRPSMFGNNNVMPTQSAEAARAFFSIGDAQTGTDLLSGVARAATVFTEQPGSFPERMDDAGKGEYNYVFGNPSASYIYAYIRGLFGIERREGGALLALRCAFPEDWNGASVRLPYADVAFSKNGGERVYTVRTGAERVCMTLFFPVFAEIEVSANGARVAETKARAAVNASAFDITLEPEAERFTCTVRQKEKGGTICPSETVFTDTEREHTEYKIERHGKTSLLTPVVKKPRARVRLSCRYDNCFLIDGRAEILDPSVKSAKLTVRSLTAEGEICFTEQIDGAAELREHRFFRPPVRVLRAECVMESGGKVLLRQTQLLPVLPVDRFAEEQFDARSVLLDIDSYLDSPFMSAKSAWRNMDDYPIMPLPYAEKGVLRTGAGKFRVKASPKAGEHCVCCAVAERGFLHEELQIPEPAAHESKLAFPVGRKVRNVGILFANELMARLCSAEAARLTFRYNEGEESFVLRGGKQLGGMFNNFAEETFAKVDLDGMQNSDFAAVLWYPADGTRILEEVCIEVLLHDCQIAVLGISLMV